MEKRDFCLGQVYTSASNLVTCISFKRPGLHKNVLILLTLSALYASVSALNFKFVTSLWQMKGGAEYLRVYNFLGLTAAVTAMFCSICEKNAYVALLQAFFLIEIVNSRVGVSRNPVFFTTIQLFSRMAISIIVYKINYTSQNTRLMFICWYLTDSIRYVYYLTRSSYAKLLRYNIFLIAYPCGTFVELTILKHFFAAYLKNFRMLGLAVLSVWVSGFFVLYGYMLRQRRVVFRAKGSKTQKLK